MESRPDLERLQSLSSTVRMLVDQVEHERDGLLRTARPLQKPLASLDHWQQVVERVIPLIPALLAAAAGTVLLLWVSGRWSPARVRKWMAFAAEAFALWRSLQPAIARAGLAGVAAASAPGQGVRHT